MLELEIENTLKVLNNDCGRIKTFVILVGTCAALLIAVVAAGINYNIYKYYFLKNSVSGKVS